MWRALAVAVLLLSYAPIGIEHAAASTKVMLVIIHTTVAVVLLPMAHPARIMTAGLPAGQVRRNS